MGGVGNGKAGHGYSTARPTILKLRIKCVPAEISLFDKQEKIRWAGWIRTSAPTVIGWIFAQLLPRQCHATKLNARVCN
jgi:hypothetical protein